jgi:hypothetical protein
MRELDVPPGVGHDPLNAALLKRRYATRLAAPEPCCHPVRSKPPADQCDDVSETLDGIGPNYADELVVVESRQPLHITKSEVPRLSK